MIINVGPYPPPIGGISIHIKRIKEFLEYNKINTIVWDYSSISKNEKNVQKRNFLLSPFLYMLAKDKDIIHYHIPGKLTKLYISIFNKLLFKKRKKMITIHGDCRFLTNTMPKLVVQMLNTFDAVICVKPDDKSYLQKIGVKTDIYEISPFIPPIYSPTQQISFPEEITQFLENHHPILTANASRIAFHDGNDLYGIDMCISVCEQLKKEHPKIGMLYSLPQINDKKYFERMKQRIHDKNLQDNFLFLTCPIELHTIISKSDIFLRPTNTDGDAVSLNEALYLKIPSIASDAVPRPKGTILFKNRDINDFHSSISQVLNDYKTYKNKIENVKIDSMEHILKIYKKLS